MAIEFLNGINVSGDVGIGVASAQKALDVGGEVLLREHLFIGGYGENDSTNSIEIGRNRTGDGICFFDMTTDNTTYTDYGFRLIRYSGVNANTELAHRGTGDFKIRGQEASNVTFSTSNSERMRIASNGDVGIGTTNPGAKLQVDSGATNVTSIFKSSDNQAWISVKDSGSATYGALFGVDTDAGHEVVLANNSATKRLVIDTSGNVGIGTTSPQYQLHSYNEIGTQVLKLGYGAGYAKITTDDASKPLELQIGGSTKMSINQSGDVGIGTTSPLEKLHVAGTVKASGLDVDGQANSSTNLLQYTRTDSTQPASISYDGTGGFDFNLNGGTVKFSDTNSGSIGIGTTSPGAKLDVVGNVNTDNSISIQGVDTGNPSASSEELRLSGYGVLGNRSAMYITNGHATGTMRFGVGGSGGNHGSNTKMVLNSSGNLGIGTTSPTKKLQISHSGANDGLLLEQTSQASGFQILQNIRQTEGLIWQKQTSGSFTSNLMTLGYDGNLGVGTTSPSEKLHVSAGNVEIENNFANLYINSTSTTGANNSIISQLQGAVAPPQGSLEWKSGQWGGGSRWLTRLTSNPYTSSYINLPHSSSGGNFAINIESNERLTIDRSNGNVGIGTTNPLEKLHVEGNLELQSNFQISSVSGNYWQRIRTVDGSASTTNAFLFETRNGSGNYLSHMVIRNDGNVGIGTATPAAELEVNGAIRAGSGSVRGLEINTGYGIHGIKSYYGTLYSTTQFYIGGVNGIPYKSISALAFYVNSDYRLKSNVTALENAIERVKKLNVCRFNWKDKLDEEKVDGFIAHEVAEVIPEAVTGDKDAVREDGTLDPQQIDQSKVVPLLTAALKEAIEKIEQLENRIQTLENN